jgi:hypothetical protein
MKKPLTREQIREHLNRLAIMKDVKINKTINPTVPPVLRKILQTKRRCEDCPRIVKNRVIEAHVVFYPVRHWLQKCNKCDAHFNHRTGRYELSWQTAHSQTLTDIGYHKMQKRLDTKKPLTLEQQRDLQLYRNQMQSQRAKIQLKSKNKDK